MGEWMAVGFGVTLLVNGKGRKRTEMNTLAHKLNNTNEATVAPSLLSR